MPSTCSCVLVKTGVAVQEKESPDTKFPTILDRPFPFISLHKASTIMCFEENDFVRQMWLSPYPAPIIPSFTGEVLPTFPRHSTPLSSRYPQSC